jgi:hypothetical protein
MGTRAGGKISRCLFRPDVVTTAEELGVEKAEEFLAWMFEEEEETKPQKEEYGSCGCHRGFRGLCAP